jgi:hypothetical protein
MGVHNVFYWRNNETDGKTILAGKNVLGRQAFNTVTIKTPSRLQVLGKKWKLKRKVSWNSNIGD